MFGMLEQVQLCLEHKRLLVEQHCLSPFRCSCRVDELAKVLVRCFFGFALLCEDRRVLLSRVLASEFGTDEIVEIDD
jgi:hypothetical protein